MPERICSCGHAEDEHNYYSECTVVGGQHTECPCGEFEHDPVADEAADAES